MSIFNNLLIGINPILINDNQSIFMAVILVSKRTDISLFRNANLVTITPHETQYSPIPC